MTIIDINYPITMSEMQAGRGRTAWLEGFSLNSPLNVPVLPTLDLSINTSTHTQELEGSTQRRLPSGPLCHPSSPCPSKPPISLGSHPPPAWPEICDLCPPSTRCDPLWSGDPGWSAQTRNFPFPTVCLKAHRSSAPQLISSQVSEPGISYKMVQLSQS